MNKKKVLITIGVIVVILGIGLFVFWKSDKDNKIDDNKSNEQVDSNENNKNSNEGENTMNENQLKININGVEYTATLEDNETTREFVKRLPIEFTMKELNGNEKYIYMNDSLPTNSINPKHINAGDIMLYGNDCLVIFYKSFDTSYSYTRIGHIDNLKDLGKGNVTVKFE